MRQVPSCFRLQNRWPTPTGGTMALENASAPLDTVFGKRRKPEAEKGEQDKNGNRGHRHGQQENKHCSDRHAERR